MASSQAHNETVKPAVKHIRLSTKYSADEFHAMAEKARGELLSCTTDDLWKHALTEGAFARDDRIVVVHRLMTDAELLAEIKKMCKADSPNILENAEPFGYVMYWINVIEDHAKKQPIIKAAKLALGLPVDEDV